LEHVFNPVSSNQQFLNLFTVSGTEQLSHITVNAVPIVRRFRLWFEGMDGAVNSPSELTQLVIEASADFTNWQTLSSNGIGLSMTNGQIRFEDVRAVGLKRRYYRVLAR
jgi:hypothetical protein